MYKTILTFSLALLLTACATARVRSVPQAVRAYKKVDFFQHHQKIAFKASGELDANQLEGVLQIQKIGDEDFDVLLLTSGAYRVLHATLTPDGIAYRYLFKELDNSLVRGRINQLLYLLLTPPGTYERYKSTKDGVVVWYKNPHAKIKLTYPVSATGAETPATHGAYPVTAHTVTALNTAVLRYGAYMPVTAEGDELVPHELVYEDGGVVLTLELISLK